MGLSGYTGGMLRILKEGSLCGPVGGRRAARHGVEAPVAVACHGIDITDEVARERVDDFRVKGLGCSLRTPGLVGPGELGDGRFGGGIRLCREWG